MKKFVSLLFCTVFSVGSWNALAQRPSPSPVQTPGQEVQPADDDTVVRINTTLIQVDVVVTDRRGNPVANLRPEDFEILENGKLQKITNFSFVTTEAVPGAPLPGNSNEGKSAAPTTHVRLRPEQVKRTIALVVDDLSLSFESAYSVRRALKKFVDEQMRPGDLIAIIRTGTGIGALQQFTADKRLLYAAIELTKYNPMVGRISVFTPRGLDSIGKGSADSSSGEKGIISGEDDDEFRETQLANGTLTAVNYVVRGMRGLPGRKAVMLMSEGFPLSLRGSPEYSIRIRESINRLVDSSNRAGVVLYTMDARGLQTVGLNAADAVGQDPTARDMMNGGRQTAMSAKEMIALLRERSAILSYNQDSLKLIAEQTGGFALTNDNDLSKGIRKALDDQKSYYLIGYQPDASTFDPLKSRFNKLKISVRGSGLKVRYRSGFFGVKDEAPATFANTPQRQVLRALSSPFASDDINLRLTPLYGQDAKAGSFVRALVHIPAKDLTFTEKAGGERVAVINIVAYTFGDNGLTFDSAGETHTITLGEKLYERALKSGFVYSLHLPVKKAGAYQLRVAVRDDKSQKVGSASEFITIPDIKKERLTLSGIALSSDNSRAGKAAANEAGNQPGADAPANTVLTQAALRRFKSGDILQYAYAVYNAKLHQATGQPHLLTQIKLFRDGEEIFAGQETPYDAKGQADLKRLTIEGGLQLGGLPEGEYVLEVSVTDLMAKQKYRKTTSWVDFDVVK
ncbi:MAG TPA: VWA domain-containing protein [Pyrinomonadaceae bacterium]|nr:VWA domain-containing protein [Pyrinomonadaceae bacterium]